MDPDKVSPSTALLLIVTVRQTIRRVARGPPFLRLRRQEYQPVLPPNRSIRLYIILLLPPIYWPGVLQPNAVYHRHARPAATVLIVEGERLPVQVHALGFPRASEVSAPYPAVGTGLTFSSPSGHETPPASWLKLLPKLNDCSPRGQLAPFTGWLKLAVR